MSILPERGEANNLPPSTEEHIYAILMAFLAAHLEALPPLSLFPTPPP
jgi:hypothetical protein